RSQLRRLAVQAGERAVAAEQVQLQQRLRGGGALGLHGVHDERLERAGDRLGDRVRAVGQDQLAAAGRDREAAFGLPALGQLRDRAAGGRDQRAAGGRAVAVAVAQARVDRLQLEPERRLDGLGGRGGDREAVRVDGGEV